MREMKNEVVVEGYVYDASNLTERVTGENSKSPNTPFVNGTLEIALDDKAEQVVKVYYTYEPNKYAKSGKTNNTYKNLVRIIENPEKTFLQCGTDALKVSISSRLGLNDFYSNQENDFVSIQRVEGGFLRFINEFANENPEERNKFTEDMFITRLSINEDEEGELVDATLGGYVFDFRKAVLPVTFKVKDEKGISFFESLEPSVSNPILTSVWGRLKSTLIQTQGKVEESAFGEQNVIKGTSRSVQEWVVTGTSVQQYELGEEDVLTSEEMKKAIQDREVYLASIKTRQEEYEKTRNVQTTATPTQEVKKGSFNF